MDLPAYKKQARRWSLSFLAACAGLFAYLGYRDSSLFLIAMSLLILPIGGWIVLRTINEVGMKERGKPSPIYEDAPMCVLAMLLLFVMATTTGIDIGLLFMSMVVLTLSLVDMVAEIKLWRSRRWRFSLRTLIIAITLLAVVLGMSAMMLRGS